MAKVFTFNNQTTVVSDIEVQTGLGTVRGMAIRRYSYEDFDAQIDPDVAVEQNTAEYFFMKGVLRATADYEFAVHEARVARDKLILGFAEDLFKAATTVEPSQLPEAPAVAA